MSFDVAAKRVLVGLGALVVAAQASGCLSDDTSITFPPREAASYEAGPLPSFDGGTPVSDDAGADSGAGDAGTLDAAAPRDGGSPRDAAIPSQAGLVAGGTVGHSPRFKMTGTTGPATAPVLRSPRYQLVGGMAVTGKKP